MWNIILDFDGRFWCTDVLVRRFIFLLTNMNGHKPVRNLTWLLHKRSSRI